jgi:hypothetical protein
MADETRTEERHGRTYTVTVIRERKRRTKNPYYGRAKRKRRKPKQQVRAERRHGLGLTRETCEMLERDAEARAWFQRHNTAQYRRFEAWLAAPYIDRPKILRRAVV